MRLVTIKKRKDFLVTAQGSSYATPTVIVQAAVSGTSGVRFGFTATKRIGKANARNRARRRLREVVRLALQELADPGCDYVLVARHNTGACSFARLTADARKAVKKCNKSLSA
jgi:ribonuclease P protein component